VRRPELVLLQRHGIVGLVEHVVSPSPHSNRTLPWEAELLGPCGPRSLRGFALEPEWGSPASVAPALAFPERVLERARPRQALEPESVPESGQLAQMRSPA
jgi:hypothetical protein